MVLIIKMMKRLKPEFDKATTQKKRQTAPNLNSARGRGNHHRNQGNLIQSHSIFESGPAESLKRCNKYF